MAGLALWPWFVSTPTSRARKVAPLLRFLVGAIVASSMVVVLASPSAAIAAGNRIPWLGGNWYLQGANYPWANYGNDFGSNAWGAYGVHSSGTNAKVDADFAKMATEGIHVVRWWVFCDGRAGITFSGGLPTGMDTFVFQDLDAAVAIAAKYKIYLNLVLLDFSWMNDPVIVSGVQLGGHADVINTTAGQTALMNSVLVPVLQRYGHNPQIISWEIMNEPEWAITEDGAVNPSISHPSSLANFDAFTTLVATAVHANTQSYATVGEAAMKWAQQWKGLGLDFYQIHYYDWMRPYANTNLYAATYASLNLDRPVVVGEFPAAGSSTATLQQYLDTWLSNGYAGTWAWSYVGVDTNGSPDATVMTNWANVHASDVNISPQGLSVSSLVPSYGPTSGGTPVTINGIGFTGATAVKFGSVAASTYSVNSATQISATSPPGSGTVDVTVTTGSGTSAVNAADRFMYLPSIAALPVAANKAYGGYSTVTYIQNTGATPASIAVRYFDSAGQMVGVGDHVDSLQPKASWTVSQDNGNGLAAGAAGSAVVYSNQPVAAFVNEFAPGGADATSYTGIDLTSATGSTLYAPAITNNAYGGYTTGIGLVNVGLSATNLTVTYRDGSGATVKTQTLNNVAAGAYLGLYSGDAALGLPSGFVGTATIASSAGPVAAIVNETGPGGQFSSYDPVPTGSTTLFAPAALNNAYGGYNTGIAIQNTTGTAGTVTINYYDALGAATTKTLPIVANGYVGVYQGTDIPVAGAYTAKLTSTVAIAAIVNEVAPAGGAAQQSTAYNTFPAGSATLHLPLVESAGPDGWSTGEGIMNTGAAATTVTVTYFDAATGAPVGTPQIQLLQPNAFWGLYQPAGGLPGGTRASAVITTSPAGQVAVVCNESNATTFMSYNGQ